MDWELSASNLGAKGVSGAWGLSIKAGMPSGNLPELSAMIMPGSLPACQVQD